MTYAEYKAKLFFKSSLRKSETALCSNSCKFHIIFSDFIFDKVVFGKDNLKQG